MSVEWWYLRNGAVQGPTATFHLTSMLRDGTLGPASWVWTQDRADWVQIGDIPDLRPHCRPHILATMVAEQRPPALLPDPAAPRPAAPLQRLLAQGVDQLFGNMMLGLLVALTGLYNIDATLGSRADSFLIIFTCVLFSLLWQAPLVALTGTTPGKRLLGLRLLRADGTRPGLGTMLHRQVRLWVQGLGFGLHLIAPFTMAAGYKRLVRGQRTAWDEPGGLTVVCGGGLGRHPFGFLFYMAALSVFPNLPNIFHALTPSENNVVINDAPMKEPPPIPTVSRWTNPVTGKEGQLVTGWMLTTSVLNSGGTGYVFWKNDRPGRGMMYRKFADHPFPDFVAETLKEAGQPAPQTLPPLTPDAPVCVHFEEKIDADGDIEVVATRLCGLLSGEVWFIIGRWPQQDEAEQSRVQALMDGLERTLW